MFNLKFSQRIKLYLILISIVVLINFIVGLYFVYYWKTWTKSEFFLEDQKCPICYGVDQCPDFYTKNIFVHNNINDAILNYINTKNVFVGSWNHQDQVILKKLAPNYKLRELDRKACNRIKSDGQCNFKDILKLNLTDDIMKLVDYHSGSTESKRMIVCPDPKGIFELVKDFNKKSHRTEITMANIWTILNINGEPIILKYLNADKRYWAVPKYHGACGRLVLEDAELDSVNFNNDWLTRVTFAIDLLKIADNFTFGHERFRFYLLDITMETIAYSYRGIKIVDLENVIVLDKMSDNLPVSWEANHTSEVVSCEGCLYYSTENICEHYLSDHNHYSVCKFLKEEILINVPEFIQQVSPNLWEMISDCIIPPTNLNRFDTAKNLVVELESILQSFPKHW